MLTRSLRLISPLNLKLRKFLITPGARLICLNLTGPLRFSHNSSPVKLSYDVYETTVDVYNSLIPPLLIQHGLFGSKQNWRSVCKVLCTSLPKIVAVDARNHGNSTHCDKMNYFLMRDDTLNLMDKLKLDQVVLLGHSMGGKAAMVTALTQPQRVSALIVVDVSPQVSPSVSTFPSIITAMKNLDLNHNVPLPSFRKWADTQLKRAVKDPETRQFLSTNLVKEGAKNVWRINLDSIENNLAEIMEFPRFENTYNGPTLFINGEKSSYISEADEPEIKRLFPNYEIAQVKGAGHWVHSDKPQDFMKVVRSFLEDTYL